MAVTHVRCSFLFIFSFICSPLHDTLPLVTAAEIPAIIVFGDSTVDTGNNNRVATPLKSDFEPYGRDFPGGKPTGRFCNGRLAPDFIAEGLGLVSVVPAYLDPAYGIQDFATAVCFASAGTGLDNATSDVLGVIPLLKEVEYFKEYKTRLRVYLGRQRAERVVRNALYIVSIGTNDLVENYYALITGRFKQFTIQEFEDFLIELASEFIAEIYHLGARVISFTGLSPIGCLPLVKTLNLMPGGAACIEGQNRVARDFNAKLSTMVQELNVALPGIRLILFDVYQTFYQIIHNPSSYGFENALKGCCATGSYEVGYLCNKWSPSTCPDADKYVFWDAIHPTEKTNRIFANLSLRAILNEFI